MSVGKNPTFTNNNNGLLYLCVFCIYVFGIKYIWFAFNTQQNVFDTGLYVLSTNVTISVWHMTYILNAHIKLWYMHKDQTENTYHCSYQNWPKYIPIHLTNSEFKTIQTNTCNVILTLRYGSLPFCNSMHTNLHLQTKHVDYSHVYPWLHSIGTLLYQWQTGILKTQDSRLQDPGKALQECTSVTACWLLCTACSYAASLAFPKKCLWRTVIPAQVQLPQLIPVGSLQSLPLANVQIDGRPLHKALVLTRNKKN